MKIWKNKLLLAFLFFLASACVKQPQTRQTFSGLLISGNQCKTMARKQAQLARHVPKPNKNCNQHAVAAATANQTPEIKTLAYAPATFTYYQPIATDSAAFPEFLASTDNQQAFRILNNPTQAHSNFFRPQKRFPPAFAKEISTENLHQIAATKKAKILKLPAASAESKKQETGQNSTNTVAYLFGLSALLSAALLRMNLQKIRKLSEWASQNLAKSRGLLALIRIATAIGAVSAGNFLASHGIAVSEATQDLAAAIFAATAMLYPIRNSQFSLFKASYLRQKLHDLALFTTGTLMLVSTSNHYDLVSSPAVSNQTVFSFPAFSQTGNAFSVVKSKIASRPDNPDDPKPTNKKHLAAKIALTTLVIAVFSVLTIFLLALACNIACAGFSGLAVLVFLAGETGLAVLLVLTLKKIFPKKNEPTVPEEPVKN